MRVDGQALASGGEAPELLAVGVAPLADADVSELPPPLATARPAAATTATPPRPMAMLGPPARMSAATRMLVDKFYRCKTEAGGFRFPPNYVPRSAEALWGSMTAGV